jgi:hypothetical protein
MCCSCVAIQDLEEQPAPIGGSGAPANTAHTAASGGASDDDSGGVPAPEWGEVD